MIWDLQKNLEYFPPTLARFPFVDKAFMHKFILLIKSFLLQSANKPHKWSHGFYVQDEEGYIFFRRILLLVLRPHDAHLVLLVVCFPSKMSPDSHFSVVALNRGPRSFGRLDRKRRSLSTTVLQYGIDEVDAVAVWYYLTKH